MPYKSDKQRAWMHINKPNLAKKWDKKYDDDEYNKKKRKKNALMMIISIGRKK